MTAEERLAKIMWHLDQVKTLSSDQKMASTVKKSSAEFDALVTRRAAAYSRLTLVPQGVDALAKMAASIGESSFVRALEWLAENEFATRWSGQFKSVGGNFAAETCYSKDAQWADTQLIQVAEYIRTRSEVTK